MTPFPPFGVRSFYSTLDVLALFTNGELISVRAGGLLLGRRHVEGHVAMFHLSRNAEGDIEGIRFFDTMEGGEFIVNHSAYHGRKERFDAINDAGTHDRVERPEVDEHFGKSIKAHRGIRVFNTHAEPHDRLVLLDPREQFIVNKRAVMLHLDELWELNELGRDA